MPEPSLILIAGGVVLAGALVQGGVGFGMNVIAAPIVTLLDPALMPGSLLIVALGLSVLMAAHEWRHADWRGLGWSMTGRLAGTVGGVWLVAAASPRLLGAIVGAMVLLTVAITVRTVGIPVTPHSLVAAGAVSGVTGTATSIGGPPMALLYQHAHGPRIRATLAVFFFAGTVVSLASLGVAGELQRAEVVAGVLMVPFAVAGFAVAGPLRRYLDTGRTRAAVLVVAAVAALVVLARSLA